MRRLLWYDNSSGSDRNPKSLDNPVCLSVQSYGTCFQCTLSIFQLKNAVFEHSWFSLSCSTTLGLTWPLHPWAGLSTCSPILPGSSTCCPIFILIFFNFWHLGSMHLLLLGTITLIVDILIAIPAMNPRKLLRFSRFALGETCLPWYILVAIHVLTTLVTLVMRQQG
jgi:hypothetical protein